MYRSVTGTFGGVTLLLILVFGWREEQATLKLFFVGRQTAATATATAVARSTATTPSSVQDNDENFFSVPSHSLLKERLCPSGMPNTALGPRLFELAREVLLEDTQYSYSPIKTTHHSNNDNVARLFYNGTFEGVSFYLHPEDLKANVMYVRIWKAGNNQIRRWEEQTFLPEMEYMKQWNSKPQKRKYPITYIDEVLTMMKQDGRKLEDLCLVTALRDPISHFLSGYNEAMSLQQRQKSKIGLPPHRFVPPHKDPQQKFRQFISDLLNQHVHYTQKIEYWHVYSMARILPALQVYNLTLNGYLPSLNNLTHDYPPFVRETCPNMPSHYFQKPMPLLGQHESSLDKDGIYQAAKEVWKQQGGPAKALCVLHAMDYACWEDSPDGVPHLCQQVYADKLAMDSVIMKNLNGDEQQQ